MPIYAYRCDSCGARQEVLQKISDAPLTVCPACGEPRLRKELSAPAFQLKGSGWYVTDFRDKDKPKHSDAHKDSGGEAGKGEHSAAPASTGSGADSTPAAASASPAGAGAGSGAAPVPSAASGGGSSGTASSGAAATAKPPVA